MFISLLLNFSLCCNCNFISSEEAVVIVAQGSIWIDKLCCFKYDLAINPTTLSSNFYFWFWFDAYHLAVTFSHLVGQRNREFSCYDFVDLTCILEQVKFLLLFCFSFLRFCI